MPSKKTQNSVAISIQEARKRLAESNGKDVSYDPDVDEVVALMMAVANSDEYKDDDLVPFRYVVGDQPRIMWGDKINDTWLESDDGAPVRWSHVYVEPGKGEADFEHWAFELLDQDNPGPGDDTPERNARAAATRKKWDEPDESEPDEWRQNNRPSWELNYGGRRNESKVSIKQKSIDYLGSLLDAGVITQADADYQIGLVKELPGYARYVVKQADATSEEELDAASDPMDGALAAMGIKKLPVTGFDPHGKQEFEIYRYTLPRLRNMYSNFSGSSKGDSVAADIEQALQDAKWHRDQRKSSGK